MRRGITTVAIVLILSALPALCQAMNSKKGTAPIYRVTVTQRTTKAINYQYRSGPTRIDFRGTVLMPQARGEATVESKRGRTEVDARFEHLTPPTAFGREYLTYVLWALTPDGRPHNIAEVVANASDKAKLRVTTDFQAFALIVTAEPYSAVRQPSDVVVLENHVRSDTVGTIEEVEARYELMPRGHYSWQVPENLESEAANAPKVLMPQYEALLELYQAENAVGIARAADAERYAPNTLAKAQQLLEDAQQLESGKVETSRVVESAREAAETAEDARVIAERRRQQEALASAKAQVTQARQATKRAEDEARQAKAEADAARSQAEIDRTARERAEAEAAQTRARAAQVESEAEAKAQADHEKTAALELRREASARKTRLRMKVLEQLNGVLASRDTGRGLMVTIPDAGFRGSELGGDIAGQVARVSAIVNNHPGLQVEVDGHTDSAATEDLAWRRARSVRDALVAGGLSSDVVRTRGLGDSRLLVSNSTAKGREENRRVEIIISGDSIGALPYWNHPYLLTRR